ncbi:mucin-5AC isoform X4 [Agrilus planipennis]|uniref:Mucin-5AC isoform X4 n=1 Tax=Agrilus planipennis TaxID=224129 RepID=A0A1W4XA03_AGRPL|nr:mucin-5AC isoform X4 [Agrilus planipennis]
MQQMGLTPGQPLVPGQVPTVATNPYLTGVPQVGSTYSPYFAPGPIMPTIVGPDPTGVGSPLGVVPQTVVTQQKMPRSDRLEMDMKSMGSFYYDNFAFPGMVPYKRPAADKSGVPVYQPNATTYQQLMQLQQPFVPVSCEYSVSPSPAPATSNASPAATDTSQLPQSSSQVAQTKEDDANTIPASTSVTIPPPSIPDPATLAKEVAQQNYAKAVKLAAANSSLTTNPLNHLNPLNYTGIALNKQAVGITSAQAAAAAAAASFPRFPALPVGIGTASTGLNHLAFNPYNAYAQTTNLLNFARAPQAAATAVFNPYSFIRAPFPVTTTHSQFVAPNMLTTGQYPVSVAAAGVTQTMTPTINNVPPPPTHIAAAAAQNNNNSVVPPYKKLKTS